MKDEGKTERLKKVFYGEDGISGLANSDIVREYLIYMDSTPAQKKRLKMDWDEYYKKVQNTKAYKRWAKIRELYKKGNIGLMKEFCAKAKKQLENQDWELSEPSKYDPDMFFRNTTIYSFNMIEKQDGG